MKRFLIFIFILFMTACNGNSLDIDLERVQENVSKKAMEQKIIEEGGYKPSDIEVIKVCESVRKGDEEQGFQGYYLVYWQTGDREYNRNFVMNKDYKLSYKDNMEEVPDRCVTPD